VSSLEPGSDAAGMDISASGDIPAAGSAQHRAIALDVLRGAAILMMVFSGCIPFDKPLPSWLFHAQEPTTFDQFHHAVHIFDPTHPGITFVDLVFPLFLFSLGAAIPLALSRKLEKGASLGKVISGGFIRLAQLSWFAVYIGNLRPTILHDIPVISTWLIALLGYVLLFPMFVRLPESRPKWQHYAVRILGFGGGAALLLALSNTHYYPAHLGFELKRVDVIIVALADMALFGTVIWVFSRTKILFRLGTLAFLLAIRLGASQHGWLQEIWTYAPKNTGWLFAFDYLKYLFIVIPGTIAGDLIHQWIKEKEPIAASSSTTRLLAFVILVILLVVAVLVGLEARLLWQTALCCFAATSGMCWLLSKPVDSCERLVQKLMQWGVFWLLIGILVEPFEGGIKKDPSTLSYYFITAGLAFLILGALMILTAIYKIEKPFSLLAYNGQNPMIAYVTMANLILPILALTHIQPLLDRTFGSPWLGVLLGALETLLLACIVSIFSSRRIFWRT